MVAEPLVLYAVEEPLTWLTFNRPDKLNAVGSAMITELNAALDKAEADEQVRVILVEGAGRAFSAGFDLDMGVGDELENATPEQLRDTMRRELHHDFDLIMRFWDSTETPESKAFNEMMEKDGIRAAIQWRRSQFNG